MTGLFLPINWKKILKESFRSPASSLVLLSPVAGIYFKYLWQCCVIKSSKQQYFFLLPPYKALNPLPCLSVLHSKTIRPYTFIKISYPLLNSSFIFLFFFFCVRVSLEHKMLPDRCQPVLIHLSSVQHIDLFVSCTALEIKPD